MQIQAYLYSNIIRVQIWDPAIFSPRNRVVYSRPITVYQGIDNPLQIVVKNQDQKAVDLTGYTGAASMRKSYSSLTAVNFSVGINESTSEVSLSLTSNTTNNIVAGRYVYDCELTTNTGVRSRLIEGIVTVTPQVTR